VKRRSDKRNFGVGIILPDRYFHIPLYRS